MAGRENTMRIVLVGKTGHGKSATANTILGRHEFMSKISPFAVTKACQRASRSWEGKELVVVDTPGLFDTKESLKTKCSEISRCVIYSCPGPHAIILVLQLGGRFTEEERKTVDLIKGFFGEEAMKYMIVLFTRKDDIGDQSIEDCLVQADGKLTNLISECGGRYVAFNNKADEAEKENQVRQLVELIEKMKNANGGSYFSNKIYEDAEETLNARIRELKEKYTQEFCDEMERIEKEHAHKLEKEKEAQINSARRNYDEKMSNVKEEAKENALMSIFKKIKEILSEIWHKFWP